ncbi:MULTISPECIES: RNA polymerase sigma factor [unclassified Pseudomonas]|uniref:RNA polymerase sigma factor n=1 Tax=unclassified Pseudomonas TaxID=196821 RepID=UPI000418B040|nr:MULTISPECIES: RNA polymerase sigma factor [unclassified Pseudomonas]ATP51503.1 RNA polymerase subunit sigma-24 [Pseudomonas putida]SMF01430.1 RNA polymerase sigma-70 factor, ECF subfamily [Pseudomonas sp. LAIL14HWK12:I11]SMR72312.1 RNA polymerase sigma-70 factor, ECF subfamily [Pseudomonas sp. LAIL14HWK12:I10]SOD01233.1 RNA polymerase sigma-70 factor, ECF subfamily [Pseudomonas sp. LAIL14HWK12:I8]GHS84052.1 DNA-directed RNA polymerase sigma-70 factor [Pseudomonas sp. PAGU 2196]
MAGLAQVRAEVEAVYRRDSRRILATLIRLLGDFDLAEEAMHDAFFIAVERWQRDGIPANPRAWLVSTGRFKAIDALRRRARFDRSQADLIMLLEGQVQDPSEEALLSDDRLRLIFTCCHPALAADAQVPLTLREVCDLTTEQIARAFLQSPATIAQRIVRAKAKIRDAGIPYQVPALDELPERLESVLRVIYLVFNEGYSASSGDALLQQDLTDEAIRLGRLLGQLLPDPEVIGLLALMLLQASRQRARIDAQGNLVVLEQQDRSVWDRERIEEGCELVRHALRSRGYGAYTVQAAIAAVHAEAATADDTDWDEIVGLYDVLQRHWPSAVVALNRAVALAKRDGPQVGLAEVEAILAAGELHDYHLAHAARAELHAQLGHVEEARAAWQQALALTRQAPERRHIERRLQALK